MYCSRYLARPRHSLDQYLLTISQAQIYPKHSTSSEPIIGAFAAGIPKHSVNLNHILVSPGNTISALIEKQCHKNTMALTDNFLPDESKQDDVTIKTRSYQREMFEESMKGNIIVAVSVSYVDSYLPFLLTRLDKMDTGTGKTHV